MKTEDGFVFNLILTDRRCSENIQEMNQCDDKCLNKTKTPN